MLPAVPQKSAVRRRPSVALVGPGNLGTALALTLAGAGYPVKFVVIKPSRARDRGVTGLAKRIKAQVVVLGSQRLDSNIVWLTVPDDSIAAVARTLATSQDWKGKYVFHSAGRSPAMNWRHCESGVRG